MKTEPCFCYICRWNHSATRSQQWLVLIFLLASPEINVDYILYIGLCCQTANWDLVGGVESNIIYRMRYAHVLFCCGSGAHFTNDFSITIQIRWKFHLALIQLLMTISQQNLAHAMTAQLSCHVPNIVAITILLFGWEQIEISITFELWWKNC